jgi:NADH dehydrogenase
VVWTAGVRPHPSLKNLSVPLDDRGRVRVDHQLRVEGQEGVWALGDCAAVPDPRGGFAPPTAQHGIRQARLVAANVAGALGGEPPRRYGYSSRTAFVNLGRYKAVGRIRRRTFSGFLAWWLARTYHLSQIPGAFRKLRAVIDWTVSLPFARDLSEVGSIGHPRPLRDQEYELGGSHRPIDAG